MNKKLEVRRSDVEGATIYDLAFIIQGKLMAVLDYKIASGFQRQIFKCRTNLEMLKTICNYVVIV
ncbi:MULTISPECIES: hypothetical protein [Bacillus]|uniref:hypothetical protein n=1 Tax=Bacillus TaxID=1386 RepID=UPI000BFCDC76|nr:hypothetical protein [Bacillus wiedmannii]PHE70518.1 hypothetical protein COF77_25225 [Bacillus wiedmannii]